MKNLFFFLILLAVIPACNKDTFYDKFVPEVLYYQNSDVENADFKSTTLARGVTQYTVKARVSAPMKLKDIKLYKTTGTQAEELLETYTDFQLAPTVSRVNYVVKSVTGQTTIRILATDQDNKTSSRNFVINVTP